MRTGVCLAVLLTLAAASAASAQTTANGSIRGYVKDEQGGVLPGVTVTATSPDVGGFRIAVSDAEGFYRLLDLPPATYAVKAELEGFAKLERQGIEVLAGLNLGLDLVMKIGSLTETVEVKAETPMIESYTPVQATNIAGDLQRSLPLTTRRNWSDFMSLTAGVSSTFSINVPNMFVHGSDVGSHVFQLDGVDVTASALGSPVYSYMSSEVLQDVQVKTGGVGASAPIGQGAVVNMVSRSGSNDFHGNASLALQRQGWSDDNNPGGTTASFSLLQPDVSLGGPVRRDRMWFFGTYRRTWIENGVSRTPAQVATLEALVPGFEPTNSPTTVNAAFGKATAQLTPDHQFMVFVDYNRQKAEPVAATYAQAFGNYYSGGPSIAARYTTNFGGVAGLKVGATYNNLGNPSELRSWNTTARNVYAAVVPSGGRLLGSTLVANLDNTTVAQEAPSDKLTFTADFNYYRSGRLGSHDIQTGVYLQPRRLAEYNARYAVGPGGATLENHVLVDPANPAAGTIPFQRVIYDTDRFVFRSIQTSDYAWYVQDTWRPSARVTVNAGLRVDWIHRTDRLFDFTVQDTTAIGPRVGANYLLTRDGRNIVRASWGRVHDSVTTGSSASAGSNSPGVRNLYDVDLDGEFETVLTTPGVTALTANRVFDLDSYRQPHADEWIVGYQVQLPGQVSVDTSLIRRSFRDRAASVEVNGIYDGGVFQGYRDEDFNEIYRVTSNEWNWPTYTAIQVQASKRTSTVQLLANYVRQWRHISGTWQPNDPASIIQPGAFPNDKGVGSSSEPNSLSGSADAVRAGGEKWRDHSLRLGFVFSGPSGLRLSSSYVVQDGLWSGPIVARIAAPDPAFGPSTVTLSNGRVVPNPLATTVRFAHATRGEGQFRTPWTHEWNVSFGRVFRFGSSSLEPGVSVLNVLNAGGDQMMLNGGNQTYSPNYGLSGTRQPPRSVQLSVRYTF